MADDLVPPAMPEHREPVDRVDTHHHARDRRHLPTVVSAGIASHGQLADSRGRPLLIGRLFRPTRVSNSMIGTIPATAISLWSSNDTDFTGKL
ncbi:hypothetical protein GYA93_01040 [Gordonia desulfuricans]|uniref:Uncharacterized protein n=1 Tax=Gordonia desulfuricans TaxID=89051 RepID=A0A7K3LIW6_9ACTN|nr:hypothetical protein [Gordonia desulfuricans]NDK88174.1 hypothetical protein [Gordonia desulfuricans]